MSFHQNASNRAAIFSLSLLPFGEHVKRQFEARNQEQHLTRVYPPLERLACHVRTRSVTIPYEFLNIFRTHISQNRCRVRSIHTPTRPFSPSRSRRTWAYSLVMSASNRRSSATRLASCVQPRASSFRAV